MTDAGSTDYELPFGMILSSQRRVNVARYLLEESPEPPVDVGDLAEGVAAIEVSKEPRQVTGVEKHRVYVSLIQSHLDPLHRQDVVRFDHDRNVVYPGANLRTFYAFAILLPGSNIQ